jgi:PAS domain S-box-containing protein
MDFSFLVKWLLGFTAAANLVLGVVAFRKAPYTLLNRLFLGFALNASLWTFTVLVITLISDYAGLLFWIRFSHAVAATTPWFVYALVDAFQDEKAYPYKKVIIVLSFSLILAVLSFTPTIIPGIGFPLEHKEPLYGPLFPVYPLFFSGVTIYTIYKLFRQLHLSRGIARNQLRYFIGGILISFIMGTLSNLFLPLLGVTAVDLRPFGPVFTLIMIVSIAYAIVKYRLMDIRIAVRRVMAYILAVILLAGIYVILLLVMEKNFRIYLESNNLPFTLVLVILVAIFFQPLKDKAQSLVDRYFYRGAYDYYDALIDANKAMVSILRLDELLRFLVDKVVNTIYIERGVFLLKNKDGSFIAAAEKSIEPFSPAGDIQPLEPGSHLLAYLQKKPDVLLLTDLKDLVSEGERELLVAEMRKLHGEAVVPIIMEEKLEAIFCLGFKISGEPYSRDDVNLLSTLSYQIAVSLKNARLYQEVLEIKQYLENILTNMGNGLIAIDGQGRITTFNSTAERLTGIAAGEILGCRAEEVLDVGLYRPIIQTLNNGHKRSEEEVEIQAGNHTSFLCCSTAQVESLDTGERGAIMVLSDVTRIKELEREKSQAMRLASLGELAAGMAHEIKNPLVSIKTFAELLPYKYDDHEFRHGFSHIVKQEIERINKLIMELLNFSRSPQPNFEDVDIKVVMDEILMLLTPQLNTQKIQLCKLYHKDLPALKADRDQLKQALLNICLNGIQAMPEGGELEVEIFSVEKPAVEAGRGALPQRKVKILIKDTGTGIDPRQKERVFDPFFTTKTEGIGIGLSISHRIITDHGGTVQFNSSLKGTVFEICLPVTLLVTTMEENERL